MQVEVTFSVSEVGAGSAKRMQVVEIGLESYVAWRCELRDEERGQKSQKEVVCSLIAKHKSQPCPVAWQWVGFRGVVGRLIRSLTGSHV